MSLLQDAIKKAITPEERAASKIVAVLSEAPQESAMHDHFSTDPASGYDAAQIALRLFDGGFLGEFSDFLNEKSLSPNIVLANGLTLLQNSLMKFPKDMARLNCLLDLGANPNLFMCKNNENGFGKSGYRAAYHPLNYAFANCPQNTTPDICATLRRYGASVDGLKFRLEVDPALAVQDDKTKAQLRQSLIIMSSDPACIKKVRMDVDLSVLQKELTHVETQLASAGFQVVSYVAPVQNKTIQNIVTAKEDPMPLHPGYKAGDKGIFVGEWEPKNQNGKPIGKKFNVFAAPEDLTDASGKKRVLTFHAAAKEVAKLINWHGHDGGDFANDTALYQALQNNSYKGEWFIPPKELLSGKDNNYTVVCNKNNLYELKDTGDFSKTFTTAITGNASWYWSSTESGNNSSKVYTVQFKCGKSDIDPKEGTMLNCRPCRLEPAP